MTLIQIKEKEVQQWMNHHYGYYRHWANHGSDKVEEILKHFAIIPKEAHYKTYNPQTDCVEFVIPTQEEMRQPSIFKRIKYWFIRKNPLK